MTWALLWWSAIQGFDGTSLFNGGNAYNIFTSTFSKFYLSCFLSFIETLVGFNLAWTAPLIIIFSGFVGYQIDHHESVLRKSKFSLPYRMTLQLI